MDKTATQSDVRMQLQAVCFAMMDMQLYLDTHPFDQDALRVYRSYLSVHQELKMNVEKQYGPLSPQDAATESDWLWVNSPWPWEPDANGRS